MISSLAFIFIVGLIMAGICEKLKLPRIIGMIFTGIIIGPYGLDLLEKSVLEISPDLRSIALIIILLKAGFSLNIEDLKKVGRPAVLMSFVPASFEILAYVIFAPMILGINMVEAGLMGAVMGAVSPAVVVPRMTHLMDKGYGSKKGIPQLIMAGASCDDIFVIVLFSTFLGMAQGNSVSKAAFLNIPISIILGILMGAVVGYILSLIFENLFKRKKYIRNSTKVVIILGMAFMMMSIETWVKPFVSVSGLLSVVSMAAVIKIKSVDIVSKRLSEKFGKLWIGAELILFVLVGAAVDINYMTKAGISAVIMIFIGLIFRNIGVFISILGTNFNKKEKLYCMVSYIPKATVQAAIGSVPLSAGLPCGQLILSVAVLIIIITAPLGAILMDYGYKRWLEI